LPEKGNALALVSDVKGRDKKGDRFISPELQIAGGSGYARGHGFEEFEVFEDLNASHTTPLDDRPGMSTALADGARFSLAEA
jgi:hypothetical protein